VQLREVSNGVPTQTVLAEARVPCTSLVTGTLVRFGWDPVELAAKREYAIVALCDDGDTALAIAQGGQWDITSSHWIGAQPYNVGVLLSSSNASTWTAHQDADLCFGVIAASYTQTERVVDLGTVNLVDATDLFILGYADQPSAAAYCTFEVALPARGLKPAETVKLTDGQIVWLSEPTTCTAHVYARLRGDAKRSAVLQPGVQVVQGTIAQSATYVSTAVTAGNNSKVSVVYEGDVPGGAAVLVHVQSTAAGAPWLAVPNVSANYNIADVREFVHELSAFSAPAARIRLTLSGSTTARPALRKLRFVVI
jgi:hypothetical protein